MKTIDLVAETNRIEGIQREPYAAEIAEHERFTSLDALTVDELKAFVKVYQPDARLRDRVGLNVRVGNHIPPAGGPEIAHILESLLYGIQSGQYDAWEAHCIYETLHPFTDGNGRSGRAVWYWMMYHDGQFSRASSLGFLHSFYYQTLQHSGRLLRPDGER